MSNEVEVKFKLGEGAIVPSQATSTDAGWDVYANQDINIPLYGLKLVPTGLSIELPDGYEAQVRGRSGNALKRGLTIGQGVGTIDAGYRGEVGVLIKNMNPYGVDIAKGDKIAQLVIKEVPKVTWKPAGELSTSDRGEKGFGSSGK